MTAEQITRLLDIVEDFAIPVAGIIVFGILAFFCFLLARCVEDFVCSKRVDKALEFVTIAKKNMLLNCEYDDMSNYNVPADKLYDTLDDIEKQLVSKVDYKLRKRYLYKGKK